MNDIHGLSLATRSSAAAAAFNEALRAFAGNRADLLDHIKAAVQADGAFSLAHCLMGCVTLLAYNRDLVAAARDCHRQAAEGASGASPREQAHVRALGLWVSGDSTGALREWEAILAAWPHDLLAMRLAHSVYFWNGRLADMRASVERVMPAYSEGMEGYGAALASLAFGLEETHDYAAAERAGRRAVEIDPTDAWAAHAVAHVMEMQGRRDEGVAWVESLAGNWAGKNSLVHHMWWHNALFRLGRGESASVVDLYDRRFRDLAGPLTAAMPDFFIDVQNAASMLFRLEQRGIGVGARWEELADKAQARTGDCLALWTLPHWMMALAGAGRQAAAQEMLRALRTYGAGTEENAAVVREVALPVCEAILAHRRGEHSRVVSLMAPARGRLYQLGGSNAQRGVLEALFLESFGLSQAGLRAA